MNLARKLTTSLLLLAFDSNSFKDAKDKTKTRLTLVLTVPVSHVFMFRCSCRYLEIIFMPITISKLR